MRSIVLFALVLAATPAISSPQNDLGFGRTGTVQYVHHWPDPVTVRNGNFFLPAQDYFMSCYGFPLEVYRSYNSISTRNGPFGRGWTFNYDIQIVVDLKNGMTVVEADGFVNDYLPVESDLGPGKDLIDRIVEARKKEDVQYLGKPEGKGSAFYKDLRQKLDDDPALLKRQTERYFPTQTKISPSGKYVSHQRGTTTIEKGPTGFIRTTETGRREEYSPKGLLTRVTDRNGDGLTLSYNTDSRLDRVRDSCGQWLQFSYTPAGKISKITDYLLRELTYQFDKTDHLLAATTVEAETAKFAYDKDDRMTLLTFADGSKVEMTYDPKSGYVTKQAGPGTKVTTYTYGRSLGTFWAKVEDNEGEKSKYEYLDAEDKIIFTDRAGKKIITTLSACCGKPISIVDERGVGDHFKYDATGNLVEKLDAANHLTKYVYEPRFNHPSEIRLHDNSYLRFVYDKGGNLSFVRSSGGEHVQITNDAHGKIVSMNDHRDVTIKFEYNRFGKPTLIEKSLKGKKVGSIAITYSKAQDILKVAYDPKRAEVMQEIKETLASFLRFMKPSGIEFEI
ncbi:MAG: DUF6531 domain-containing protein [Pseudomonadota bacterium]